jgi:sigma-B regulation protein RsbU (phosphoserine phosphatase)
MTPETIEQIKENLQAKRDTVADWLETTPPPKKQTNLGTADDGAVQAHLHVIDTTLDKAAADILGICKICHQPVDTELLEMDYTAEVCLAHLSAQELHNLELELELVKTVQRSLLPQQLPETTHLEFAAFSRPAQIVGGDYFDFFRFRGGADGLTIADVMGHGISASLYMASIQALLRTLIPSNDSPAEVVRRLQRMLIHNVRFTTFVTLFLAAYEPATQTLTYCNAGHNPPLLYRAGDSNVDPLRWLSTTGAAIGLIENAKYEEAQVHLEPGDILLLYTDGVTEAANRAGEFFEWERLAEVVQRESRAPAAALVKSLRQALEDFIGDRNLEDDTTILACRIVG